MVAKVLKGLTGISIPQAVETAALQDPKRRALMVNIPDGEPRIISYGQMVHSFQKIASFIQREGYAEGAHIALLGPNSPEWAIAYLAIQTAGCTVIPLDSNLRPQEHRHILRHSEAKCIFVAKNHREALHEDGEDACTDLKCYHLEDLPKIVDNEKYPLPPRYPKSDNSPAAILYTSGTTGSPKGVILTHRNILANIEAMPLRLDLYTEDNFISVLPMHHAFEATCGFLLPLTLGCGICYARALRGKEILEDIQASDATIILGVPLLFEKFYTGIHRGLKDKGAVASTMFNSAMGITRFLDSAFKGRSGTSIMKPFRNKIGFAGLRLMVAGGAAIRPDIVKFFTKFGVLCIQGYGLTETSPVLAVHPNGTEKEDSVGPPIKGVELKISTPDSEGVGEVLARGDSVFKEYFKNEEATRAAFTEDGWFKTGDLGMIDDKGFLFLKGREKNIIVTAAGKNVYPEEIEEHINKSPFILESIVVGHVRNNNEEPFAIIVPDFDALDSAGKSTNEEDMELFFKEIINEVNQRIAPYKRVKNFKIQQEEFPKTSTRKIKRYLFDGKRIEI